MRMYLPRKNLRIGMFWVFLAGFLFSLSSFAGEAKVEEKNLQATSSAETREQVSSEPQQKGGVYTVGRAFKTAGESIKSGFAKVGDAFKKAGSSIKGAFIAKKPEDKAKQPEEGRNEKPLLDHRGDEPETQKVKP